MKIEFKAVRKRIDLAEYAPELAGAQIDVWVNVTRDMLKRLLSVSSETPDDEFFALLEDLWGAETWPVEDIRALWEHCREQDPQLFAWLWRRTNELIIEYQGLAKKK